MKKLILKLFAVAMSVCGSLTVNAVELYLVGDACQWGYNFNAKGNAMVKTENAGVFKGITHLTKSGEFKFVGQTDWSGSHYLMKSDSKVENGVIQLVKGTGDDDGLKLKLGDDMEDGNYEITVDTNNLTCTLKRAEYQDSPVWGKAIFMVGDAAPNGWAKDNGLALTNTFETPYIYSVSNIDLKQGDFKFEIWDNAPWDKPAEWLYKDKNDASKFNKGQEGDSKWNIATADKYDVSVDSKTGKVTVIKTVDSAVEGIASENATVEYYSLSGVRIAEPVKGIYIRKQGNKVQKIAF